MCLFGKNKSEVEAGFLTILPYLWALFCCKNGHMFKGFCKASFFYNNFSRQARIGRHFGEGVVLGTQSIAERIFANISFDCSVVPFVFNVFDRV